MRIIYDIDRKPQVMCGYKPMPRHVALELPESFGATVDIFRFNGITGEEEPTLFIRGNAVYLLHALREAVGQLEALGQLAVERGELFPDWSDMEAHKERRRKIREFRDQQKAESALGNESPTP